MAQVKKKKNWPLMLTITIPVCQYVAAHVSGWINEVGSFDLMATDKLMDYFVLHPLDIISFNPLVYLMVYACGFAVYFHILFSREPPRAEMKGEEHGSSRFMTQQEKLQFSAERTTPNFPYMRDCKQPGEYPKGGGKKK